MLNKTNTMTYVPSNAADHPVLTGTLRQLRMTPDEQLSLTVPRSIMAVEIFS